VGGDAGEGIAGVVQGRDDGRDRGAAAGEIGTGAELAGVAAGWCPGRVGVGELAGPEHYVADFGGDGGEGRAAVGGEDVPVVGEGAPGPP
jgi:hypothetical protein